MKSATTIGIDLAKNSFSVYSVDDKGKTVLSRTLTRAGVVRFFANLPSCLVGMEACASSDYWPEPSKVLGTKSAASTPVCESLSAWREKRHQ